MEIQYQLMMMNLKKYFNNYVVIKMHGIQNVIILLKKFKLSQMKMGYI